MQTAFTTSPGAFAAPAATRSVAAAGMSWIGLKQLEAARRIFGLAARRLEAKVGVKLWDGSVIPLGGSERADIRIVIRSPAVIRRLLLSPNMMTIFELYASGELDFEGGTPLAFARRWDLLKALQLSRRVDSVVLLRSLWPFLWTGVAAADVVSQFEGAVKTRLERGRNDRDLVQFHYDVSNEFYALVLDPELVYSCAYFERPGMSLAAAQAAKLDMVCRRLRLQQGDRFLDIGCGWGALVCHAAQNYGVTALGVTLSEKQHAFAQERIRSLGLADRVSIELRDYRSLDPAGQFDKIAQIEMFEHVGLDNHDRHFAAISTLLRPNGLYLHQATTRRPTFDLEKFRKRSMNQKVVTRFIFPGGELDHVGMTIANLERHGFEVHDVEGWREHYLKTLEHWISRLEANREQAERQIGRTKVRLWLLYFSLFALGFERGICGIFQTLASKQAAVGSCVPPTLADLHA